VILRELTEGEAPQSRIEQTEEKETQPEPAPEPAAETVEPVLEEA